jgi:hypothetical protein
MNKRSILTGLITPAAFSCSLTKRLVVIALTALLAPASFRSVAHSELWYA